MAYMKDNFIESRAQAATIGNTFNGDSKKVALFLLKKEQMQGLFDAFAYTFRYLTALLVQAVAWPFFYVVFHTIFDLKILGQENIKGQKAPLIFISNHIGFYDSFMFDIFTAPFSGIAPFRFMGTTQLDVLYLKILKYTGIVHVIFLLFGVVNVKYGKGAEHAIKPMEDIVRRGGTVAIFPEGKIWTHYDKSVDIGPFKWGAAMLARNTGGTVVPVSFMKARKRFFRDKLTVNIGEPYQVSRNDSSSSISDDMRERVMHLFHS